MLLQSTPARQVFNGRLALILLMILQFLCAAFFVHDVIEDFAFMPTGQTVSLHLSLELVANLGLIAALYVEFRVLKALIARQREMDRTLSVATGSLFRVMEADFAEWGLTRAEADVAHFTIKGFSVAEVAQMRKSSEGTVKSQLNAIYRKSGLTGRAQLVSLLIEELLQGPLAIPPEQLKTIRSATPVPTKANLPLPLGVRD
jgi:DNA-binding CsgD family transcriptional regulator